MTNLIEKLKGTVIVSCQARSGDPFDAAHFIAEFAKSAVLASASGLRIDRFDNISAVKKVVQVPIVGIRKNKHPCYEVFITPTKKDVQEVIDAGAEIVGMDGTNRSRPDGSSLRTLVDLCHSQGRLVLADIATVSDAEFAASQGVDLIATTLAGYTEETKSRTLPDLELLQTLTQRLDIPIVLEGGVMEPSQVYSALKAGAHAVIIGKAITMPHVIARRFVEQAEKFKNQF